MPNCRISDPVSGTRGKGTPDEDEKHFPPLPRTDDTWLAGRAHQEEKRPRMIEIMTGKVLTFASRLLSSWPTDGGNGCGQQLHNCGGSRSRACWVWVYICAGACACVREGGRRNGSLRYWLCAAVVDAKLEKKATYRIFVFEYLRWNRISLLF